jgi:WD40 repeat protein
MQANFEIPATNHPSDQPAEIFQKRFDTLLQSVTRIRSETDDLSRLKNLCVIHIQQYEADLEKLRDVYRVYKSRLDSLNRFPRAVMDMAPDYPRPPMGHSPPSLATLSLCDIPWRVEAAAPKTGARLRYALDLGSVLCTVRFNHTGSHFAFTDGKVVFLMCSADGSLVGTVEIPRSPHQEDPPPRSICFSPNGRYIAVAAPQYVITVIEVGPLHVIGQLDAHKHHISSIVFFSDGRQLITGGFDGKLCLWSVPELKLLRMIEHGASGGGGKDEMIVAVALGTDDEYIAVGFMSGSVGMYEPTFSQPMSTFLAHSEFLLNVVISPMDLIATASHDTTAKLWTLRGVASCKQVLRGHTDFVLTVAFPPKDQVVFTGSKDETIRCWSQKTGEQLFILHGHKNTVFQIDAHPKERWIVACSGDGLVCMWEYFLP